MAENLEPSKLCPRCHTRKSGPYPGDLCRRCYDDRRASTTLTSLGDRVKEAQISGDWKALADSLTDTIKGVADGSIKATAAQGSILRHIMDRAYGRVTKTQEEKKGPIGVVVLPTLEQGSTTQVCSKCLEYHLKHG